VNVILSKEILIRKSKAVMDRYFIGITLDPEAMIVGGTIRDILLGRTPKDIDIATPDVSNLVESFESKGYTHVILDERRNIHRMVKEDVKIDVTPLNDGYINDLLSRDFTINSIGIVIKDWEVLDPQGGLKDLSKGLVRALSQERFIEDPLRLIRAFRIAADLGFTIDPVTLRFITKLSHLIMKPSRERIRDELCWTLEADHSYDVIESLTRTGMLGRILPEFATAAQIPPGSPFVLGLTEHLLWTYKFLEDILSNLDDVLEQHADTAREKLSVILAADRRVFISMKLAALLHDVGKPATLTYDDEPHFIDHDRIGAEMVQKRMEELRFSSSEIKAVGELVLNHMRPHNLAKLEQVTDRAVFRFFRDLDDLSIPCLLIALADAYATQMVPLGTLDTYQEFVRKMIEENQRIGKPKPILNGEYIMKLFKIEPGREVGILINLLLEAQALKQVQTKEEAIEFLKKVSIEDERNA